MDATIYTAIAAVVLIPVAGLFAALDAALSTVSVARVEEMLRRQERLENRLSGAMPRPGAEEAPAIFTPPERHI